MDLPYYFLMTNEERADCMSNEAETEMFVVMEPKDRHL